MQFLLVHHKVADFSKWKPAYDAHLGARQKAGLKEKHLLRNIDSPNEVVLLFEAEDIQKAKESAGSSDLREAMAALRRAMGELIAFLRYLEEVRSSLPSRCKTCGETITVPCSCWAKEEGNASQLMT